MPSVQFEVQGDREIVAKLYGSRDRIFAYLKTALNDVTTQLQRHIRDDKLQGQVLHHRSGNLSRAVVRDRATVEGNTITAKVILGKEAAKYGLVHEFGGTFTIPEHMAHWKSGRGHGPGRKRKRHVDSWTVSAHTATYPERSFMRSSFVEFRDQIETAIRDAVNKATR